MCVSHCSFAIYKSYKVQKWIWTSLVRIGVRSTRPSTLPDTQQIHIQVDSKRKLPLAKLSTPPSASRPQPPDNESKYDAFRTADTSDAKHVLPLALPTRLQPLNTKHDAPQTTDISSETAHEELEDQNRGHCRGMTFDTTPLSFVFIGLTVYKSPGSQLFWEHR